MNVKHMLTIGSLVTGFAVMGCGQSADKSNPGGAPETQAANSSAAHGEWWCNEHGVPEEVCALCSTELVADFKAKGDWCKEHDRPDSQCFICHPEKEAEFAALYEAKYGKKPPKPEASEGHDHDDKHEHEDHQEKS